MKKFIPFLISGILVVGAVGCQDASKTSDAGSSTTDTAVNKAKEAASTTQTAAKNTAEGAKTAVTGTVDKAGTAVKGAATGAKTALNNTASGAKTIVKNNLEKKFPGSKLDVEEKDGVLTIKGTVPDEATLKKIEPAVKEYKFEGIKTVKVEAKVAANKAQ
ncbi:MAG: BON domain-containing protein [Methylacidiphilales bacterium]|nr:BON domain-containing protein [Candidatus Methylacidiphilales bacterium]